MKASGFFCKEQICSFVQKKPGYRQHGVSIADIYQALQITNARMNINSQITSKYKMAIIARNQTKSLGLAKIYGLTTHLFVPVLRPLELGESLCTEAMRA